MASPDPREFRQMRHDVDDVYRLLAETQETVQSSRETIGAVLSAQRRHGVRLEEIQLALDLQNNRMDRLEDLQHQQGERLGRVENGQREQGERLGRVENGQREQGERLGRVEGRLDGIDIRLDGIEGTQQEILTLLRERRDG